MNSLGIVVPMRNKAPHIQRTLCSALHSAAAAGMSCELIVIDNGSTDAGYALAQALGARVISAPGLAVGALRNLGASQVRADYLAFLDADIEVPENWISRCLDSLQNGFDVVALDCDTPKQAPWYAQTWQKRSMSQTGRPRERDWLATANLFMRRITFARSGGFHPELSSGEDKDFGLRLHAAGMRQLSLAQPPALHWGYETSWREWMNKELWRQGSYIQLLRQAPGLRLLCFPLLCLLTVLTSLRALLLLLSARLPEALLMFACSLLPAAVVALRQSARRMEPVYTMKLLVLHWLRLHIGCLALIRSLFR